MVEGAPKLFTTSRIPPYMSVFSTYISSTHFLDDLALQNMSYFALFLKSINMHLLTASKVRKWIHSFNKTPSTWAPTRLRPHCQTIKTWINFTETPHLTALRFKQRCFLHKGDVRRKLIPGYLTKTIVTIVKFLRGGKKLLFRSRASILQPTEIETSEKENQWLLQGKVGLQNLSLIGFLTSRSTFRWGAHTHPHTISDAQFKAALC